MLDALDVKVDVNEDVYVEVAGSDVAEVVAVEDAVV